MLLDRSGDAVADTTVHQDPVDAQDIPLHESRPPDKEARGSLGATRVEEDHYSFFDRIRNLFQVRQLDCQGNARIRCDTLLRRLAEADALRLSSFSFSEVGLPFGGGSSAAVKVLRDDPWIEQVTIELFPFSRRAVVQIQEAIPWFVTELRKQTWVVSRRGALLQELISIQDPALTVEISQLPRVRGIEMRGGDSLLREAERVQSVTQQLAALEAGGTLPFEVEAYELLEDNSLAVVPFDAALPTVFFHADSADEGRLKLRLLKEVLQDARNRGERLARVDLRVAQRAIVVRDEQVGQEKGSGKVQGPAKRLEKPAERLKK